MVVKVKLSRSLEKKVVSPTTTLTGFFWAIIRWVMIFDSVPCRVLPSWDWLLGLFICTTVKGRGE